MDFLPQNDAKFDVWQREFRQKVNNDPAGYGVTPDQAANLNDKGLVWDAKWSALPELEGAYRAGVSDKDKAREELEGASIRPLARQIQNREETTDKQRKELGLPIYDTQPTPSVDATTRPILHVDSSQRLRSLIRWVDESTPNSRRRPDHCIGLELRAKFGDEPPAGPNEATHPMGFNTASPHLEEWDEEHGGQKVWILGRWIGKNGSKGPWSETVMSTIVA